MKVVILAGGYGSRISEESHLVPKPMIEIGHRPLLWHIMKIYSHFGFNDFVICLGFKSKVIKDYFLSYDYYQSDFTIDFANRRSIKIKDTVVEPWKVTLVDTGEDTMTGARIKSIEKYIDDDHFMLTYGDGVAAINLHELVECHRHHNKIATVTAVNPPGRFGMLHLDQNCSVTHFNEKPTDGNMWINGGFFVLSREVFRYLPEDCPNLVWEQGPLEQLTADGQLHAFKHTGFWHPMDTLRDKHQLEQLWNSGDAAWKVWAE